MANELGPLAGALQRRQLTTPVLLFIAGHRPLAFFAGQLLYLFAPLALLAGWEGVNRWAELLSDPDPLFRALHNRLDSSHTPRIHPDMD